MFEREAIIKVYKFIIRNIPSRINARVMRKDKKKYIK